MAKNISSLNSSLDNRYSSKTHTHTAAEVGAITSANYTNGADTNIDEIDYSSQIGILSSLQTNNKNNLVAAINELFQSGANAKQQLVDTLVANGMVCSTSDSWNTLINHVNEGAGGGLDIISATALPATGKEGQICVVMDTPSDAFMITSNLDSTVSDKVVLYTSNSGSAYLYSTDSVSYEIYFFKVLYNGLSYPSYYWSNNQWNTLTIPYLAFLEDGRYTTEGTTVSGGLYTGDSNKRITYTEGTGLVSNPYNAGVYMFATFINTIDLSRYTRVEFTVSTSVGGSGKFTLFTSPNRTNSYNGGQYGSIDRSLSYNHTAGANVPVTYSFDISSWNDTSAYLGVSFYQGAASQKFTITDFYLY